MLHGTRLGHVIVGLGIGGCALAAFADGGASLVRTYKDAALVEISADGRLMLARRNQRKASDCPESPPYCTADVLEVYETATGKSLGQLVSGGGFNFVLARFLDDHLVVAVEQDWKSNPVRMEWDLASGRHSQASSAVPKDGQLVCALNDMSFLFSSVDQTVRPSFDGFAVANAGGVERLQRPGLPFVQKRIPTPSGSALDCRTRLLKDSYLAEYDDLAASVASLYWVSLHPEAKPRLCHAFPSERIRNFTLSPDDSVVAVVADAVESASEAGKFHPEHPLWLTILDSNGCSVLRRFELEFPEKPRLRSNLFGYKYYDHFHFDSEFPETMAISPDKTVLAVGYGVYQDPSGYAYFGLYSLADGHRLATLNGDVLRKWPWSGILNDEIFAPSAPIQGALLFSADSRTLFGSSQHLRQWDLSRLK
ncbi:MAG TPA: hypothetical protein VKU19_11585 [Bryobacteraceae bacterium]|nr:hypothetical protein [Bryobacteraceae bacterium]